MSYNLSTGNANKASVVALIKAENPDVIGVQEASEAWYTYLTQNLPDYGIIGFGRDSTGVICETATASGNAGEGTYILYRTSMFTVEEAKTYWLSETPTTKSQFACETDGYYRIFTYAKLIRKTDSKPLVFCNTHLEMEGNAVKEARALEVEMILDYMRPYVAQKIPVIITGDFNMEATEAGFAQFAPAGFASAGEAAINKGNTAPTHSVENPSSIIDYIMCSNYMEEINYYAVVLDARNTSDHRPVGAWVKY
jgi:endonuclease/exonuclease/phosphatase family metal-dependent hydrolase